MVYPRWLIIEHWESVSIIIIIKKKKLEKYWHDNTELNIGTPAACEQALAQSLIYVPPAFTPTTTTAFSTVCSRVNTITILLVSSVGLFTLSAITFLIGFCSNCGQRHIYVFLALGCLTGLAACLLKLSVSFTCLFLLLTLFYFE